MSIKSKPRREALQAKYPEIVGYFGWTKGTHVYRVVIIDSIIILVLKLFEYFVIQFYTILSGLLTTRTHVGPWETDQKLLTRAHTHTHTRTAKSFYIILSGLLHMAPSS